MESNKVKQEQSEFVATSESSLVGEKTARLAQFCAFSGYPLYKVTSYALGVSMCYLLRVNRPVTARVYAPTDKDWRFLVIELIYEEDHQVEFYHLSLDSSLFIKHITSAEHLVLPTILNHELSTFASTLVVHWFDSSFISRKDFTVSDGYFHPTGMLALMLRHFVKSQSFLAFASRDSLVFKTGREWYVITQEGGTSKLVCDVTRVSADVAITILGSGNFFERTSLGYDLLGCIGPDFLQSSVE